MAACKKALHENSNYIEQDKTKQGGWVGSMESTAWMQERWMTSHDKNDVHKVLLLIKLPYHNDR